MASALSRRVAQCRSIGATPAALVAVPAKNAVYVASERSGSVSVIDAATNKVVAKITGIGSTPCAMAVAGTNVYVTDHGNGRENGSVSVIDTATNKATTITDGIGVAPCGRVERHQGRRLK